MLQKYVMKERKEEEGGIAEEDFQDGSL